MGYERRGASFTLMGFEPIGKTVEVVEDKEETPVLIAWPPVGRQSIEGTVALLSSEFERGLRARRCRVALR